jgi:glycosyltransferase involved in cell wall biosynthesis
MRLLVVMQDYPLPLTTGSKIVAYHSMKYLAKRHSIDFVSFMPEHDTDNNITFITRQTLVSRTDLPVALCIVAKVLGIPTLAVINLRKTVTLMLKQKSYDAVLLFGMTAIQYCPPESYEKLFVNIEDPQSLRFSRIAELSVLSLRQKIQYRVLKYLWARNEARLLPRLAKVFLLSECDKEEMAKLGAYDNLAYLPYGVNINAFEKTFTYEERERAVIFSGNMDHPANVDAALWLLTDIFPCILKACPAVKLWIVGANPDPRIRALASAYGDQVVITGRVDDLKMYIKRATVSICPVRVKIGVQTKILEAMACSTPVVTTSAGNRGINGVSGRELWVEDNPACLAQKVVDLLLAKDWAYLSEQGKKLVETRFTWEASVEQLEQYLEKAL